MTVRSILAFAAGASLLATSAFAIEAQSTQGKVLVRQGAKVAPLAAGAALKLGDQIIVGAGAARVNYGAGCVVDLPANSVSRIAQPASCDSAKGLVKPVSATPMQSEPTLGSVIVPLAIGVGLLVVAIDSSDDDEFPTSP